MRTSRRIVRKRQSYFGRFSNGKGGELTFALGPNRETATTTYDLIQGALAQGRDAALIRSNLRAGKEPGAAPAEQDPPSLATKGITVETAVERWLSERAEVEMEKRNAALIRSRVERSLLPCLGKRSLASIRRTDCHGYLAHLRKTRPDLKPGSLHHYLRDLREVLNWAEEVELIESSPWPKRRILPRLAKRPPDRLTDQEAAFLSALPDHWGFTIRFLLATGIRWGEACRARRRDIQDGHLLIRKSKSGKPRRVPLSRAILREIVHQGGDWIVPRRRNAPGGRAERSSSSFNETIRRLAEKGLATLPLSSRKELAGLERFHVHMLRHTMACRYLEAGGTLTMLQEILGHASMEQTQQYGRPDARAIRTDADQVFARWEGQTGNKTGNIAVLAAPRSMQ